MAVLGRLETDSVLRSNAAAMPPQAAHQYAGKPYATRVCSKTPQGRLAAGALGTFVGKIALRASKRVLGHVTRWLDARKWAPGGKE